MSARDEAEILSRLAAVIAARRQGDPGSSYVASLYAKGLDPMLKKIGEEATETVLAAKNGDVAHLVRETADLWFHCLIVLGYYGAGPLDVLTELARREGVSGLAEKAGRNQDQSKS